MPKPTYEQLKKLFPRGTESFLRANSEPSCAKPEQVVRDEPLAEASREKRNPTRCSVRVESYRTRLCDPDNLVGKYFLDALRYEGILQDDTAALIDYSVCQHKVAKKEDERTVITLTPL